MPLQRQIGNAFVRSTKIFVDSEKATSSSGPMNVVVDLDTSIEYVSAIELTGWNVSNQLMPSVFSFPTGLHNNRFQVVISNAGVTKALTVTLPSGSYSLMNAADDTFTLPFAIESYLQAAIDSDGDFGPGDQALTASVTLTSTMKLKITIVDTSANAVQHSLGLETSPLATTGNIVHRLLGFDKEDTALATETVGTYVPEVDYFRYVDVVVEGLEHRPLARIYKENGSNFSTVLNDPNLTRTRLILNNPMRRLNRLRIDLYLRDRLQLSASDVVRAPFDLCFTIESIANEVEKLPGWLKQSFSM